MQSGATPTTRLSISNAGEVTIPALAGTGGVLDVDATGKIILHSGSFATEVTLASGTNNGTLKLTVNGSATDNIAVKGFGQSFTSTETSRALLSDNTNAYVTLPRQIPAVTLNGSANNSPSFYAPTAQLATQSSTNSYLVGASSTTSLSTVYSNASVYMNGATLYATTFNGALTGNSSSASAVSTSAENTGTTPRYILFADAVSGNQALKTDTGLTYHPTNNALTATTFIGNLTGNVTGNVSGTAGGETLGTVTGRGTTTLTGVTTSAYNMGTTSATTTKATMQYNATTQSVEFIFA